MAFFAQKNMELFIVSFGAIFSVMNPLGTVPIFVGLTQDENKAERSKIAFWASFNVFVILIISFFAGKYILLFFGISIDSLKIAGGLIISTSGFALLTGTFSEHKGMKMKKVKSDIETRKDISLTPLAIPMIAGPGTISLLINYNQEYQQFSMIMILIGAMVSSVVATFIMLRSSHAIVKVLGASGINALSRIIGFIVIALGIEFIISAVLSVLNMG